MKTLTIAVDIDETVADMLSPWLRRYNKAFDDTLLPECLTEWDMTKNVKPECGPMIYSMVTPDLYDEVLPIVGARSAVYDLASKGHRILYVTSCINGTADAKVRWLETWGFLPRQKFQPNFIAASDKTLVKADVLFDDNVKNVESFPGMAFLISQPHNRLAGCSRMRIGSMVDAPFAIERFLASPYRDAA